jgi:dihydroorotate dehydrogenase electron transfer subunit
MLRLADGGETTLARPFAVFDRAGDPGADGNLLILYRRAGRGTELMTRLVPGDEVAVWGPLGRGFDLGKPADEYVLVAGGIGSASFGLVVRELLGNPEGPRVVYLYGARSSDDLVRLAPFDLDGVELRHATDDGSAGLEGNVIDLLESYLDNESRGKSRRFLASGPRMMLARFAELARERGLDAQVTTEELMACGVGACQGCVAKLRDRETDEGFRYVRVCREGPVFAAADLILDTFGYLK